LNKIKSFPKSVLPKKILKKISRIKERLTAFLHYHNPVTFHCAKQWYGNDYGGFYICPILLAPPPRTHNKKIIVYSCGVGEDISFDIAIMHDCDCEVFAFDPTPKSIA
jgi:hypothetical protein